MTDEAKAARNNYYREYYKAHREQIRRNQRAYWERRARVNTPIESEDIENAISE